MSNMQDARLCRAPDTKLEHHHFDTFEGKYEPPDWPVKIEALFALETYGTVSTLRLAWPSSGMSRTFRRTEP